MGRGGPGDREGSVWIVSVREKTEEGEKTAAEGDKKEYNLSGLSKALAAAGCKSCSW